MEHRVFGTYHFQIELCPSSDLAVTQLHGILRIGFNSKSVDSKESHLFCACFKDNNIFFRNLDLPIHVFCLKKLLCGPFGSKMEQVSYFTLQNCHPIVCKNAWKSEIVGIGA